VAPMGREGGGGSITLKAFCLFTHNGAILVYEKFDYVKKTGFFRPLGGKVEFGEYSIQALKREILEETSLEIEEPELLGVLENIFVYNGRPQHEVDFVYDASFVDKSVYDRSELQFVEGEAKMVARWVPITRFTEGVETLYPTGILDLLKRRGVASSHSKCDQSNPL